MERLSCPGDPRLSKVITSPLPTHSFAASSTPADGCLVNNVLKRASSLSSTFRYHFTHIPDGLARLISTQYPPPHLKMPAFHDKLVSMTRLKKSKVSKTQKSRRRAGNRRPGHWLLQDAKARFSELVRRVRTEGPQHVTVHGRDEVVVIAAEEFRRLKGDLTGEVLVAAMQASPYREIDLEPTRSRLPVRDVGL
jgi:prevent-host-death family protein